MKRLRKSTLFLAAALLIGTLQGCGGKDPKEEQKKFDAFVEQDFINTMESDYATMHQLMEQPENFGVDEEQVEVSLGARYDEETLAAGKAERKKTIDAFGEFDRSLLNEKQRQLYDLYAFNFAIEEKLLEDRFDYYECLFSSAGGLHYALATTFADWELRDEKDVQDLIVILRDTKPYVDSALDYTKRQEEKGLLMLDLESIIEHCDGILENRENSAVLASIYARLDALGLSAEQTQAYKEELKAAFDESFIPAYEDIRAAMIEFQTDGDNHIEGLAQFEHGKEYYELLFQAGIGSDRSIDEIEEWMTQEFENGFNDLYEALMSDPEVMDQLLGETSTGFGDYESIMEYLKGHMFADFPEISDTKYEIIALSEELGSDSGIAAYFNLPAFDSTQPRQLRVNPLYGDVGSVSNFVTVAHEGYPGHMYQFTYALEQNQHPYLTTLGRNQAYSEGYAIYASYQALAYLDDVSAAYQKAYIANEEISYAVIILADIGIHYKGWDLETFGDFMEENMLSLSEEEMRAQYMQLQNNPVMFEPYYIGYLEIMALREQAESALGDDFDEKAFHEAILACGALPFEQIREEISAYIDTAK